MLAGVYCASPIPLGFVFVYRLLWFSRGRRVCCFMLFTCWFFLSRTSARDKGTFVADNMSANVVCLILRFCLRVKVLIIMVSGFPH